LAQAAVRAQRTPPADELEPDISADPATLLDLLELTEAGPDQYRGNTAFEDAMGLYGGQVAAQALRAASLTVSPDRIPHSLHSYFLRAGDPMKPVDYEVSRDRDGRSYSARRVTARQEGQVIFDMGCSFHVPETGPDVQVAVMPPVAGPDTQPVRVLASRTLDLEIRAAEQSGATDMPYRVWARASVELAPDPHLQACVLTYLSDMYSGLFALDEDTDGVGLTSLDHSLWFYRPIDMGQWVLMDLIPESLSAGRGMYFGRVYDQQGRLVAGLTQESLFRVGAWKGRGPRTP
jgi:acyl-CoA thioesterase-2